MMNAAARRTDQSAGEPIWIGRHRTGERAILDQDGSGNAIVRTRLVVDATPGKGVPALFDVTADGLSPGLPAVP